MASRVRTRTASLSSRTASARASRPTASRAVSSQWGQPQPGQRPQPGQQGQQPYGQPQPGPQGQQPGPQGQPGGWIPQPASVARPALQARAISVVTMDSVPGRDVAAVIGDVVGVVVRPRELAPELRVGNPLDGYATMLTRSRQDAVTKMIDMAVAAGADAIVAFKYDCSEITQSLSEVSAYGTAVKLAPEAQVLAGSSTSTTESTTGPAGPAGAAGSGHPTRALLTCRRMIRSATRRPRPPR